MDNNEAERGPNSPPPLRRRWYNNPEYILWLEDDWASDIFVACLTVALSIPGIVLRNGPEFITECLQITFLFILWNTLATLYRARNFVIAFDNYMSVMFAFIFGRSYYGTHSGSGF